MFVWTPWMESFKFVADAKIVETDLEVVYAPLSDVKKRLKIDWYRTPIDSTKLKSLVRRRDIRGWRQALGYLVLIAVTGGITYYLFEQRAWLAGAAALFVHGTIYSFIPGLATHELSHGTVFKTRWLNGFFLRLYSLLAWVNFHHYKRSHTYHHQYTLHPEADREVVLPRDPALRALFVVSLFTFNIRALGERIGRNFLALAFLKHFREKGEWGAALYPESEVAARRQAVTWGRIVVLFHAVLIATSIVFSLWPLPLLITFGSFVGNWWRYFIGFTMHTGLRDNVPDFRKCCRTIALDPFSRFIYWHMNFHSEHHMYAAVPCYNLRRLCGEIAWDMPKPRTLMEAWKEMRETARKQKDDPSYQFDTPVPRHSGLNRQYDNLESSLGDLAPPGLK